MKNVFEFTPAELKKAHKVLIENGILDKAKRDSRIALHQRTGKISNFSYGSLLFQALTEQEITSTKAVAKNMGARFHQAITVYAGEDGRRKLTLAMEPIEGEETHGLIQTIKVNSAADFFEFYEGLSIRENSVNNPHYDLSDTIDVTTEDGRTVTCLTCLSDVNGPLYVGGKLSEDEIASILAYRENTGNRPQGLSTRFDHASTPTPTKEMTHETFEEYVAASDKLNDALLANPNYKSWEREWGQSKELPIPGMR